GRLESGELLDRLARGIRRHPGLGHLRLTSGGGAAFGPPPAPQTVRPHRELLHPDRPRHRRPGLCPDPPALPRRTGLQLHHSRRRRPLRRFCPAARAVLVRDLTPCLLTSYRTAVA